MSDNNPLIPSSLNKAVENIIDAPTKTIGQTLSDLFFLVFGGINYTADKRKLNYSYKLKEFEKSLNEKLDKIPIENRVNPDIQIACQALEDSKYCLDDDGLREMFSELIASTMDNRIEKFAHPSFSGIIKQMSPLDGRNIILFKSQWQFPIVNIRVINKENGTIIVLVKNMFIANKDETDSSRQSVSLSSLVAKGLVEIDFTNRVKSNSLYSEFTQTKLYKTIVSQYKPYGEIKLQKGICRLSDYGNDFLTACVK